VTNTVKKTPPASCSDAMLAGHGERRPRKFTFAARTRWAATSPRLLDPYASQASTAEGAAPIQQLQAVDLLRRQRDRHTLRRAWCGRSIRQRTRAAWAISSRCGGFVLDRQHQDRGAASTAARSTSRLRQLCQRSGLKHDSYSIGGNYTFGMVRANAGYFHYTADQGASNAAASARTTHTPSRRPFSRAARWTTTRYQIMSANNAGITGTGARPTC